MATQLDVSTLNLQDALDMALLIEKEAEERYRVFAETIGERYPGDAAAFFKMMAKNEHKHCVQLAERRRLLFSQISRRLNLRKRCASCLLVAPWRWHWSPK